MLEKALEKSPIEKSPRKRPYRKRPLRNSCSKMASIYKTQGKLADALVSYEKTLEVATINFGAGHKNVGELAPPHAPFPTL